MIGLWFCQSASAALSPRNDWPRSLRPASRQTLTFTGLGKMAPLRVTMTDLDGTRFRPEPPRTTGPSPPFLKLGPLRRAPDRREAKASQRAAPDAISQLRPSPGLQLRVPESCHRLHEGHRPKSREVVGAHENPSSHLRSALPSRGGGKELRDHPPHAMRSRARRRRPFPPPAADLLDAVEINLRKRNE